jgi:DNA-binding transcriptional MerR regulator
MTQDDHQPLHTADVARKSGYSLQQVRDLERQGVIPPAIRGTNGYRAYSESHVQALQAYRGLASAAGPVVARRLLASLFTEAQPGSLTEAAAAIGAVHVRLATERDEALRAQEALSAVQAEPSVPDGDGTNSPGADTMTITELAAALGVRTSTLRFWEQEGLAIPERVTSLRARQYGPAAIREARIVAALRSSGYGIPAVRKVVATLQGHTGITAARQILDRRLDQIAARTVALLRAGSDLAAVIDDLAR